MALHHIMKWKISLKRKGYLHVQIYYLMISRLDQNNWNIELAPDVVIRVCTVGWIQRELDISLRPALCNNVLVDIRPSWHGYVMMCCYIQLGQDEMCPFVQKAPCLIVSYAAMKASGD